MPKLLNSKQIPRPSQKLALRPNNRHTRRTGSWGNCFLGLWPNARMPSNCSMQTQGAYQPMPLHRIRVWRLAISVNPGPANGWLPLRGSSDQVLQIPKLHSLRPAKSSPNWPGSFHASLEGKIIGFSGNTQQSGLVETCTRKKAAPPPETLPSLARIFGLQEASINMGAYAWPYMESIHSVISLRLTILSLST